MSDRDQASSVNQFPSIADDNPVLVSRPYWVFHYPATGWANKSHDERIAHVISRALDRGGLVLKPETVISIEEEIQHVRKLAQDSKPVVPYLAKRVVRFPQCFRQDYYEVRVDLDKHVFVWSRRCNGLISYVCKGEWKWGAYR